MSLNRVTQNMLSHQSFNGLQTALNRVQQAQEQLTTGRLINRPSDDPTGATTAMRLRSTVADKQQYQRNANDAQGWLDQIDTTLSSMGDQVRRARDLALQGANSGTMGPESREALAVEVDQLRQSLLTASNTRYLDRPIFGGVTSGSSAYDLATGNTKDPAALGTGTGIVRTVAEGAKVRVDVEGPTVFGADNDNVFSHLADLAAGLRAADQTKINAAIDNLNADGKRITNVQADIGARTTRVENARSVAGDAELSLTNALSDVENVDLAKATVDLQLHEVAYQAALGATARVVQPSLLDFLR